MKTKKQFRTTAAVIICGQLHSIPVTFYLTDEGAMKEKVRSAIREARLTFCETKEVPGEEMKIYEPTVNPGTFRFHGATVSNPERQEKVVEISIYEKYRTVCIKTNRDSYTFAEWGNVPEEEFKRELELLFDTFKLT